MPEKTIVALSLFSIVTSATPGPNNLMLLSSGVSFGFARTIPHSLGIAAGFCTLLLAVGMGLGSLLTAFPAIHLALKVLGGVYLLHLAWSTATSRALGDGGESAKRPMSFREAALFQWMNPKAWVMAVTGMAVYTDPQRPFLSMAIVCAIFTALNWPSVLLWAAFGTALRGILSGPARLRWFNIAMGALLAASIIPLIR